MVELGRVRMKILSELKTKKSYSMVTVFSLTIGQTLSVATIATILVRPHVTCPSVLFYIIVLVELQGQLFN